MMIRVGSDRDGGRPNLRWRWLLPMTRRDLGELVPKEYSSRQAGILKLENLKLQELPGLLQEDRRTRFK